MARATTGDATAMLELDGLVAGYLSTIDFTPSHYHPEAMLKYAAQVREMVQEYEAAKRQPLIVAMSPLHDPTP